MGVVDEGEIPVHGDAGMEARDFPAGDGDAFDDVEGGFVDGLIDGEQAFDEAGVFLALLVAEDGGVRGDEEFEFGGVFAGFDGVAAGRGFALVAGRSMGLGAVIAGDLGAFFFRHLLLLIWGCRREKALRLAEGLFAGQTSCLSNYNLAEGIRKTDWRFG